MILEAQSRDCCSSTSLLRLDGNAFGEVSGRSFSSTFDVQLLGRRKLVFEKEGWLSGRYVLSDATTKEVQGEAQHTGTFRAKWHLVLSVGTAEMVAPGWFQSGFDVKLDGQTLAHVDRPGACTNGWRVEASEPLRERDVLLIGLVYRVIQQQQAATAAAAGGAGS